MKKRIKVFRNMRNGRFCNLFDRRIRDIKATYHYRKAVS